MNYLKERVAYLKGLAEGMQISDASNEGKLLKAIIEVMDDMALAVDDVTEVQEQLSEQLDSIDEGLMDLESEVYGEECECECEDCEEDEVIEDGKFDCPYCGGKISIDEAALNEENTAINCPHCKKDIEIEWDCDCEDCGHK